MKLNKFVILWLFIITVGAMANTLNQVVIINQNAELIAKMEYFNALIENNGGGR